MSQFETVVNDNRVTLLAHQQATGHDTSARRLAADLERNHPAVDRVTPGPGEGVDVWLAKPAGEWEFIHPPDGWTYTEVGIADTGGVCVTFAPEADA